MFHGALLIDKPAGISSFGVIEQLNQAIRDADSSKKLKRKDLPKMGHGGTLDPFATGLLIVCVGKAVKLARYFLTSAKTYEGTIRFGETTIPGDPTADISERSEKIPASREEIAEIARKFTLQPYLQTPPMHSAKKVNGRPLYELAREGIEVEREPKLCHIHEFEILSYAPPHAEFRVGCSSGTYIRTLAQDLARMMGSVAMLDSLRRTASGALSIKTAMPLASVLEATRTKQEWDELGCWIPFHRLLDGYDRAEATTEEALALQQGRQNVLFNILKRVEPSPAPAASSRTHIAIFSKEALIAIAARQGQDSENEGIWGVERVFVD